MRLVLYPALWLTTAMIWIAAGLGIGLEWTATRLVPLQKFLSRKIEGGD